MRGEGGGHVGRMVRPNRANAAGIWTMGEVSANVIDTTWPGPADANFANVTCLIHGDDQESYSAGNLSSNHWRNCAGATHSKIYQMGGAASAFMSQAVPGQFGSTTIATGTTGIGASSNSADFAFATGDFTIEGWFYFTTLVVSNIIDCRVNSGSNGAIPTIYCLSNAGSLRYFVSSADRITGAAGTLTVNNWIHIALSRVSSQTYLYANGAQVGATWADSTNYVSSQINWGSSSNGSAMSGFMQELRVTKGVGRYSGATCTVPTTKFPDHA